MARQKREFTEQDIATIKEMRANGATINGIALVLHTNKDKVIKLLESHTIEKPKAEIHDNLGYSIDIEEFKYFYEVEKWSITELSKWYNIPDVRVRTIIKDYDMKEAWTVDTNPHYDLSMADDMTIRWLITDLKNTALSMGKKHYNTINSFTYEIHPNLELGTDRIPVTVHKFDVWIPEIYTVLVYIKDEEAKAEWISRCGNDVTVKYGKVPETTNELYAKAYVHRRENRNNYIRVEFVKINNDNLSDVIDQLMIQAERFKDRSQNKINPSSKFVSCTDCAARGESQQSTSTSGVIDRWNKQVHEVVERINEEERAYKSEAKSGIDWARIKKREDHYRKLRHDWSDTTDDFKI